jgi:hypothetical protein
MLMGMDRRLAYEIAKELCAQLPLRDGCIRQEDVTGVAFAVATRLSRVFRIEWAPEWGDEEEGDELISPDAATYRGLRLENW